MDDYCNCCERKLNPKRTVFLEYSQSKDAYYKAGTVPENDSQGCFPFGVACAKKVNRGDYKE